MDATLKVEHTENGAQVILIIRNVQNVPITWEEIKIYVRSNTTSWTEVKPQHSGTVFGGQSVSVGYFNPGETVEVKVVYSETVIWSKSVKV